MFLVPYILVPNICYRGAILLFKLSTFSIVSVQTANDDITLIHIYDCICSNCRRHDFGVFNLSQHFEMSWFKECQHFEMSWFKECQQIDYNRCLIAEWTWEPITVKSTNRLKRTSMNKFSCLSVFSISIYVFLTGGSTLPRHKMISCSIYIICRPFVYINKNIKLKNRHILNMFYHTKLRYYH